jgi:predicted NBD/HSP70 family sugar kinase
LIIDVIRRLGGMTQVELSAATGLSAATVSTIVGELVANGVVTTQQVIRSGRRALQVTFSRELGLVAGLHFSSRALRVVLSDPMMTVVAAQRMPLAADHRADTGMDRAAQLIADMLDGIGAPEGELVGAALGICAPYNRKTDMLAVPGLLRGWDEVRIAESMAQRLGKPVVADNDANLAMLGEARQGVARGVQSAAFLSVGHGVGAGIYIGGEVLRGGTGAAGEIGHIRVVDNGELCRCGNRGCLEVVVNSRAIGLAAEQAVGPATLRDVIGLAKQGDLGASRMISDAARHVAVALAALYNTINPEMIVVGGELAAAGPLLLMPLQAAFERLALHNPLDPPQIQLSALGEEAAVLGAAALAIDAVELPTKSVEVTV